MKRKSEIPRGYGRLLDAWVPPVDAGAPIGCVATSYTFSPVFFEEECLGRFLQLESDPYEDGAIYLIEREEKLSQVTCAAVLVDQHYCRGSRSLRWDLLPARPRKGVLHAKLAVMHWERCIRLLVTSANLSESGYRSNLEVFACFDFRDGDAGALACLHEYLRFLESASRLAFPKNVADDPAAERWQAFLKRVEQTIESWGVTENPGAAKGPLVAAIPAGEGYPDVLSALKEIWPVSPRPSTAYVMSPFFDSPEVPNKPAEDIWQLLDRRHQPRVIYCTPVTRATDDDQARVIVPETVMHVEPVQRGSGSVRLQEIDPGKDRGLHAKGIWLESEKATLYMIGSSNFTSAGLGLHGVPNLEANVAFIARGKDKKKMMRHLNHAFPAGRLMPANEPVHFLTEPCSDDETESGAAVLPAACGTAVFMLVETGRGQLHLHFAGPLPSGWRITTEDGADTLLTEASWHDRGKPPCVELPWSHDRPPSGILVSWAGSEGSAWWPVNTKSFADLPPPEELRELPLELLLNVLTSARPLHQIWRLHRRRFTTVADQSLTREIDPHRRVDTSTFILQRMRRVSWALNELRKRLSRPVMSQQGLHWRLHGPVGVMALADAMKKEAASVEESAFLLAELSLELRRVEPAESQSSLPAAEVRQALLQVATELAQQATSVASESSEKSSTLDSYLQRVLAEVAR
jgi:hypothetical protein